MKIGYMLVAPLVCAFCLTVARAEDKVEVKAGPVEVKVGDGHERDNHEFRMRVSRSGDHYVGNYNNHEYVLRGDGARFTTDGDYIVHGDIGTDNTYITTRDFAPVEVRTEARPVVVHEREVIVEKREPLIKVGPLEIGR